MSGIFIGFWPVATDGLVFVAIVAFFVFVIRATRTPSTLCRRCRQLNRPVAIYCAQCGQRLPKK